MGIWGISVERETPWGISIGKLVLILTNPWGGDLGDFCGGKTRWRISRGELVLIMTNPRIAKYMDPAEG